MTRSSGIALIKVYQSILALLFVYVIGLIFVRWFGLSGHILAFPGYIFWVLSAAFVIFVWCKPLHRVDARRSWPVALFFVGACAFIPFVFLWDVFGVADFGSVLTSLYENSLSNLMHVGFGSLGFSIVFYVLAFCILILGSVTFSKRVPFFEYFIIAVSVLFLVSSPIVGYAYHYIAPTRHHALLDLTLDFVPPVILETPEDKKNIIYIYLESMERTYRDLPETAHAFETLVGLEDQGVSFDQLFQAYGLHFTAGGSVGTQCGVPMLPNAYTRVQTQAGKDTAPDGIMTGVTCLGDILSRDGYIGSYLNGSDLAVFSKGEIFQSHGWDHVFGVNSVAKPRSEAYENVWGLNDATLFDYAHKELERLARVGQPFMMGVLTVATHGPDAELDAACDYPQVAGSYIPAAIYCTGQHVRRFLDKLDVLGIWDDTIVVILSDHLAMRNTLWDQLQAVKEQRRNFAVVLGAGQGEVISKPGTTMDLYPTVLELLGYRLKDHRANMGVSLLGDRPTLVERVDDPDHVSLMMKQNRPLQDLLWRGPLH